MHNQLFVYSTSVFFSCSCSCLVCVVLLCNCCLFVWLLFEESKISCYLFLYLFCFVWLALCCCCCVGFVVYARHTCLQSFLLSFFSFLFSLVYFALFKLLFWIVWFCMLLFGFVGVLVCLCVDFVGCVVVFLFFSCLTPLFCSFFAWSSFWLHMCCILCWIFGLVMLYLQCPAYVTLCLINIGL